MLLATGAFDADTPATTPAGVVEELSLLLFDGDLDGDAEADDVAVGEAVPVVVLDDDALPVIVPDTVDVADTDAKGDTVPDPVLAPVPVLVIVPVGVLVRDNVELPVGLLDCVDVAR